MAGRYLGRGLCPIVPAGKGRLLVQTEGPASMSKGFVLGVGMGQAVHQPSCPSI